MSTTITVTNLDANLQALSRLADIRPLIPYAEAGGDVLIGEARTYPAERRGQRYQRSGDLGAGWERQTQADPRAIEIDVFNRVAYAPYVQGEDQAAAFAGRWRPTNVLAADVEERINDLFEAGVDDWIQGVGL